MTWFKLDDGFADHPKVAEAGSAAAWLYIAGLCYCSRNLTDGVIPAAMVRRLTDLPKPGRLAATLVAVGLWEECAAGYNITPGRWWRMYSEEDHRRAERARINDVVRQRIFTRDGHQCVVCGREAPLELDHATPVSRGGTSDDANLVTLCRPCNRSKYTRTLREFREMAP